MDNTSMVLNLKRMLPEAIKKMLQTVEYEDYDEAKEYAIKQARALMKESKATTLDLSEREGETEEKKKKVSFVSGGGSLHARSSPPVPRGG